VAVGSLEQTHVLTLRFVFVRFVIRVETTRNSTSTPRCYRNLFSIAYEHWADPATKNAQDIPITPSPGATLPLAVSHADKTAKSA